MILFRYREYTDYNIKAILKNALNGTVFSEFKDKDELNFGFSKNKHLEYDCSPERLQQLANSVMENCFNNYYLGCLTTNNPLDSKHMWKKYTHNCGFCLVYDSDDIERAIRIEINKGFPTSLNGVGYSNKIYDLSKIVDPLYESIKDKDHLADEERQKILKETSDNMYTRELGKYISDGFACKKTKYARDKEVRVIKFNKNCDDKYPDLLIVKPKIIFASKNVNVFERQRIKEHAIENGIAFELIDLNKI